MTGVLVSHCFQFPSSLLKHWSSITLPCCAVSLDARRDKFRSRGYPLPVLEDGELFLFLLVISLFCCTFDYSFQPSITVPCFCNQMASVCVIVLRRSLVKISGTNSQKE